jgi:fucose permease
VTASPLSRHDRILTGLCYAAMMTLAIGINLLPVYLTTLSETYGGASGLTKEQLGRLGAVGFGGLVAGILLTGPFADRFGTKPFALLGNLGTSVGLLAAGLAPSYEWLMVAIVILGLGAGMLDMVLSPVVAALHPHDRGGAMNWLHSFYCVGAVITILLGTLALQFGLGWRATCLILSPFPLLLLVALLPLRFPALTADAPRAQLRTLARSRWFQVALVAIFLGGATELGMAQWLPAYAEVSLGYPAWIGGTALLLFSIAMALGRMVVGAVGSRWDPYAVMLWGCASSVVLFLGASFLPHPALALTCGIAVGFTGSCLWPTMLAVSADRHPEGGATMFGALAALGNAGGMFMPWLVGWIADQSSLSLGLAISAVAPAAMILTLRFLRPRAVAG